MNDLASIYKAKIIEKRDAHFGSKESWISPLASVHAYCRDVDNILRDIYQNCIDSPRPDANFCLVALGGYGRRELWPYSDVDILIIHQNQHKSAKLSSAVKLFWNIGLTMGCVVRTISECTAIIGDDLATDTAFLESRFICGNRDLFNKLQKTCIKPYFERHKKDYIEGISAALREGIYSSENSLYRIEPDIKNGICTLRDCQRLLWAERVKCGTKNFAQLHTKSGFSHTETCRFEANYAFLTGLRTQLHIISGQRMDVLETDYQNAIASRCGFGPDGAGRLLEEFFKTVREIRLSLLSFLEKDLSGKSVWNNVRRRFSANEIAAGIAVLDGIIFSRHKKDIHLDTGEAIIRIFKNTLTFQATLSVEIRNKIRHAIDTINPDDFKSKVVGEIFLDILTWPGSIGQILLVMHETGFLGKLIPAFQTLTCKVEYDQYHEFTIDQHILLALCACDELAHDTDTRIRNIYSSANKLILRLTILMHDIGKVQAGDHAQNGAIIAENICERLGLGDSQTDQVRFLVYHHLDISNMSLQREPDDNNIAAFARDIGDRNTLDLLYLLTIVDIRSVGPHTWTGWKAYQLEQLYDRVYQFLNNHGAHREASISPTDAAIPGSSYLRDNLPEEREKHNLWISEIGNKGLQLHQELFAGFERLTVCDYDRTGFLSDIISCFTAEGYNILSARIYSTADGKVLDIFNLEPPDKPRVSAQKRISNIYTKWNFLKTEQMSADDLVRERMKKYPPSALRLSQQKQTVDIRVNNSESQLSTIIEIATADNFGLLHKITRCFHENQVNVVSAKLSTRNDRAVDVFYVTDMAKRKITSQEYTDSLIKSLTTALKA
jgi:UTP:GlnB (protein PII) uridylyltransferase